MHKQNFSIQSTNHEEDKQMKAMIKTPRILAAVVVAFCTSTPAFSQHVIQSSTGAANDRFGGPAGAETGQSAVSMLNSTSYGRMGLIGARLFDITPHTNRGAAFLFKNLETASGVVTENHILLGETNANDYFGTSLALTNGGNTAVVGAFGNDAGFTDTGAAYVFNGLLNPLLPTPPTPVSYNAKLIASDRKANDFLGVALAADGDIAVVGASQATSTYNYPNGSGTGTVTNAGAAYVYRNLSSYTSAVPVTVTQDIKLMGSDVNGRAAFGMSPTIRGSTAIVGAFFQNWGGSPPPLEFGAAYVYRNLDTWAAPTKYEDAKLVFPHLDGPNWAHRFGYATSLNETATMAAIGAYGYDMSSGDSGGIFVYKDLVTIDRINPATGVSEILPDIALRASDGGLSWIHGFSVSLSGDTLLSGAVRANSNVGALYFYDNVSSLNSNIINTTQSLAAQGATIFREQAKLWISSPGTHPTNFGASVSLDGNGFLAGAAVGDGAAVDSGTAYTGDKRTFLGLDSGSTSLRTNGLSFWSRQNWVIGNTTDNNTITISPGDEARINRLVGTQTIVGNTGNDNSLVVDGTLTSYDVNVGVSGDNNQLVVNGVMNVQGSFDENVVSPGPRNLTVGVNAGANNNLLFVSGTATVDGTTTIGRNGSDNLAVISGSLTTNQLRVGTNAGANDNVLAITTGGSLTATSTTIIGAAGNTGNQLHVDGTFTGNSTTTVNANATLSGTGTVGGSGVKNIFGKHTPNVDGQAGVQTISGGNLIMQSGSLLQWDLLSNTTAGRGTNYDGIDMLAGTGLTINTGSSIYLSFDAPGSTVNWTNTFWDVDYLGTAGWLLYDLDSGTASGMSNFSLTISADAFSNTLSALRPGAYFELFQSGNDIYINYYSAPLIPEAQTSLLIVITLLGLLALHRKLKKSGALA